MSGVTALRFLLPLLAMIAMTGWGYADNSRGSGLQSAGQVIKIDPNNDSCTPASARLQSCARACEINPLGCAQDLLRHVESNGFISRRQLYPSTIEQKPNIQTPMHGLFVPVWNNPQLNEAIDRAVKHPFAPVRMPDWSISVKLNNNPGTPSNPDPTNSIGQP